MRTSVTPQITDCPDCFVRSPSTHSTVLVPNGDGSYTRHIPQSFYSSEDKRDCSWQRADFAVRTDYLRGVQS